MAEYSPSVSNPPISPGNVLDTNNPPLESQIPLLQEFVSRGRARLVVLHDQMVLLQSRLGEIRKESDALAKEVLKHEGSLSPLRRLPTEILLRIFTFTLPPHQRDPDNAAFTNAHPNPRMVERAPWTVSAVCARWRAIAVCQPRFWAHIDYHSYYNRNNRFMNRLRLETQLRRSGETPLNVEFGTDLDDVVTSQDLRILRTLCQHSARWETASIHGQTVLFDSLARFAASRFALLRELAIEVLYDAGDGTPSLDMFSDAPKLQRVTVNKGLRTYAIQMVLPWPQLLQFCGCGHGTPISKTSLLPAIS
ncbi:hypothetical protein DFH08DRAFT_716765 [Mycena albidolilacea]|uniref:F-box domain-containing protein n=1 Tax=Mycena albidolilacea TaxID=1033008 RepID=A0AAD6ZA84_9AGAR|nr:hypothetical protein DFH08DRAFT_716765 [Mycena albidolilacea]